VGGRCLGSACRPRGVPAKPASFHALVATRWQRVRVIPSLCRSHSPPTISSR
jgi:hypothetical protein